METMLGCMAGQAGPGAADWQVRIAADGGGIA
jgi:hypothetical protein